MVVQIKTDQREAAKVTPGTVLLGQFKGSRSFRVDGQDKDSTVYTLKSVGTAQTLFDYWGGQALFDSAMKELEPNDAIVVVHYGKVKREGLKRGNEINDIRVFLLADDDIVALAKAGIDMEADAVTRKDGPDILRVLKLDAIKA